ncbi:MAG: methyltransferase [Polyangiaceae bacterium]|nr:methyltransferase [Polyangiaceae bacterium]
MGGSARHAYNDVYVTMAREAARDAVRRRAGRTTRILEIGAGHGILTWPLVEDLRGEDVEYHFTDIGRSFLLRAEEEAERRGVPWLKVSRFDLNRSPAEQGLRERFDLILGMNAAHVALDLPAALEGLHEMLVPGGSLILVELTRMEIWDELTWGLAPGYWDIVRARGSLSMDLAVWERILRSARFSRVTSVPSDPARRAVEDHGLLIADRTLPVERPQLTPDVARLTPRVAEAPAPAAAPGDEGDSARDLVRGLWARLLGIRHAPDETSFFDAGGDSLLAVQLLAEVRARTGHAVRMAQFAEDPTVRGLAALLRLPAEGEPAAASTPPERAAAAARAPRAAVARAAGAAARCRVPLRASGTKRPFFCIHPIGGGALCYAPLAKAMSPDRPFFGIQCPMLEDGTARPGSLVEMAALYADAVRQAQPEGPFLIGGWSFGGVVAIEVARQLQRGGDRVAKLVLVDVLMSSSGLLQLLRRVDERLPALAVLPAVLAERAAQEGDRGEEGSIARLAGDLALVAPNLAVYDHHIAIWGRHAPAELDVPAIHFVSRDRGLVASSLRWAAASGKLPVREVTAVRVPGDHFTILSGDLARGLGARIEEALTAAEPRGPARVEAASRAGG